MIQNNLLLFQTLCRFLCQNKCQNRVFGWQEGHATGKRRTADSTRGSQCQFTFAPSSTNLGASSLRPWEPIDALRSDSTPLVSRGCTAARACGTEGAHEVGAAPPTSVLPRTPITTADFGRAVWERYTEALALDEASRDRYPRKAAIDTARADLMKRAKAGEIPSDPFAAFVVSLDDLVMREARSLDLNLI